MRSSQFYQSTSISAVISIAATLALASSASAQQPQVLPGIVVQGATLAPPKPVRKAEPEAPAPRKRAPSSAANSAPAPQPAPAPATGRADRSRADGRRDRTGGRHSAETVGTAVSVVTGDRPQEHAGAHRRRRVAQSAGRRREPVQRLHRPDADAHSRRRSQSHAGADRRHPGKLVHRRRVRLLRPVGRGNRTHRGAARGAIWHLRHQRDRWRGQHHHQGRAWPADGSRQCRRRQPRHARRHRPRLRRQRQGLRFARRASPRERRLQRRAQPQPRQPGVPRRRRRPPDQLLDESRRQHHPRYQLRRRAEEYRQDRRSRRLRRSDRLTCHRHRRSVAVRLQRLARRHQRPLGHARRGAEPRAARQPQLDAAHRRGSQRVAVPRRQHQRAEQVRLSRNLPLRDADDGQRQARRFGPDREGIRALQAAFRLHQRRGIRPQQSRQGARISRRVRRPAVRDGERAPRRQRDVRRLHQLAGVGVAQTAGMGHPAARQRRYRREVSDVLRAVRLHSRLLRAQSGPEARDLVRLGCRRRVHGDPRPGDRRRHLFQEQSRRQDRLARLPLHADQRRRRGDAQRHRSRGAVPGEPRLEPRPRLHLSRRRGRQRPARSSPRASRWSYRRQLPVRPWSRQPQRRRQLQRPHGRQRIPPRHRPDVRVHHVHGRACKARRLSAVVGCGFVQGAAGCRTVRPRREPRQPEIPGGLRLRRGGRHGVRRCAIDLSGRRDFAVGQVERDDAATRTSTDGDADRRAGARGRRGGGEAVADRVAQPVHRSAAARPRPARPHRRADHARHRPQRLAGGGAGERPAADQRRRRGGAGARRRPDPGQPLCRDHHRRSAPPPRPAGGTRSLRDRLRRHPNLGAASGGSGRRTGARRGRDRPLRCCAGGGAHARRPSSRGIGLSGQRAGVGQGHPGRRRTRCRRPRQSGDADRTRLGRPYRPRDHHREPARPRGIGSGHEHLSHRRVGQPASPGAGEHHAAAGRHGVADAAVAVRLTACRRRGRPAGGGARETAGCWQTMIARSRLEAWLAGLLLIAAAISLAAGPGGIGLPGDATAKWLIFSEIRLPRTALAILIGGALGLCGAVLQGYLRNPLAEPGLLGVTGGATLGAVVAIHSGASSLLALALPIGGLVGAALATTAVLALAGNRSGPVTLILAGAAISSLTGVLTTLALNLSPNPFAAVEMVFWMLGSLNDRSLLHLWLAAPLILAGGALLLSVRRDLDALSLGEDVAANLGIDLGRLRLKIATGTALAIGAATSVAGSINFVGLVVPHLLRPYTGHEPGRLLPASMLGGALLVLSADVVLRIASPLGDVKLGVLTALIGAPFFLWLVLKTRRELAP